MLLFISIQTLTVYFCLQARKHILEIHTRDWNPKLSDSFMDELAEKCVGKRSTSSPFFKMNITAIE